MEIAVAGALESGELGAIARRAARATPGPWQFALEGRNHRGGEDVVNTADNDIYLTGATIDDCDFIAQARQDVPKLVAEIERLNSLVEILKQERG
jgi:hypothetical protein